MEEKEIKKYYRCKECGEPTDEKGFNLEPCESKDLRVEGLEVIGFCYECFCVDMW
jgi:hypothetical protein